MVQTNSKRLDEVLSLLRIHKKDMSDRYGLIALGVFGSVARGETHATSDVDIVVKTKVPDPFLLVDLKESLEKLFGAQVDIVRYWSRMNPDLKGRIDHEARYV